MSLFAQIADGLDTRVWESLLQGALGSLIGFLGLFFVFLLTRAHERQKAAEAAAIGERDAQRQRSALSAEAVVMAALGDHGSTLKTTDAQIELSRALASFALREAKDFPELSRWATAHSTDIYRMDRAKRPGDFTFQAGWVTSVVTTWAGQGFEGDTNAYFRASRNADPVKPDAYFKSLG